MNNPAISVIVPMYNVERYIKICIDSILGQTFQDFEIIIVDDASPDNSYNICRNIYGNNKKVRIVRHEKNQGLGSARNTGIENARGKYIYFVDSDDAILPNALETLYKPTQGEKDVDVVRTLSHYNLFQDDDKPIDLKKMQIVRENKPEGFLSANILDRLEKFCVKDRIQYMVWLALYKREFLLKHKIKFPSCLYEDQPFSFEVICLAENYIMVNSAVYLFRYRQGYTQHSAAISKFPKIIDSMIITVNSVKKITERFHELDDKRFLKEQCAIQMLNPIFDAQILPLYANGYINEELDSQINETLKPIFKKNILLAKYFLNGFSSMYQQAISLSQNNQSLIRERDDLSKEIVKKLSHSGSASNKSATFVKNLYDDEMRNGFLVTSHRKKLWNVQIGLINEFARICKKYNLKWFAYGGTLLGAVRHKGFIPWDDDVDIAMLRPDYNKFLKVAPEEIKYPYFFDPWYNYRLERDNSSLTEELNLPLIKKSSFFVGGFPSFPIIKIRDSRTTQIEFPNRTNVHQGIWIDIFPFNSVPPFIEKKHQIDFETARELLMAIFNPEFIRKSIQDKQQLLIPYEELEKFLQLSYKQRCIQFDNFSEKIFFESEKVGALEDYIFSVKTKRVFNLKNYDQTVYFPFEEIEIPAPSGWEDCLTTQYGDWRKMVYTHTHSKDWSTDIPYTEYYRTSAFVNK